MTQGCREGQTYATLIGMILTERDKFVICPSDLAQRHNNKKNKNNNAKNEKHKAFTLAVMVGEGGGKTRLVKCDFCTTKSHDRGRKHSQGLQQAEGGDCVHLTQLTQLFQVIESIASCLF